VSSWSSSLSLLQLYAKDEARFFKDFAAAYSKLLSLGVPGQANKGVFDWLFSLCR
jgi:hypothetical protein